MKVALFFLNPTGRTPETLICGMYGRYNIGGFVFVHDTRIEAFMTREGESFSRVEWGAQRPNGGMLGEMHFLLLCVDDGEKHRLLATCEACVKVRKPYNLKDVLLIHVPFREVEDLPIDRAPTLNNTQSLILILRECLNPDNRLREGIEGLHSRQTFLEELYNRLLPLAVSVTWANLCALVGWGVGDTPRNPVAMH